MIRRFIDSYIWFWKESFSFMQGYNKFKIGLQCLYKGIGFCIKMEKWHREENDKITTHKEIAQREGIAESNVGQLIRHGLRIIRRFYEGKPPYK